MIASPPIRSICPRQTRSSRFSAIRSGSVPMTWNFRLELPEFSTRIFIWGFSDLGLRVSLVRPRPVRHIGFVDPMSMRVVHALNLQVTKLFFGMSSDSLKFRNTVDGVNRQTETID